MTSETYELYIMPSCPYCHKVLNFLSKHGIEMPIRDITADPQAAETLVRVGGKRQAPCLFIDGKPLYESSDIVDYLAEHLA